MRVICLFLTLFLSMICFSQTCNIKVVKTHNQYGVDSVLINSFDYEIINNGEEPCWIWLDRNKISNNDSINIRNYFKEAKIGSDGSLYQWMCDGNVASFIGTVFSSWIKVLPPEEKFYLSFFCKSEDFHSIVSEIDSVMVVIPETEIVKQCPGINDKRIKEKFTYEPSFISIPWNFF